jgi:hypothetical protein
MIQLTCDVEYSQAIIIYENNQNIINLIKNFQFHTRKKHHRYSNLCHQKENDRKFHRFNLRVYRLNDKWRFNKIINQKQIYSISHRFKNRIIILLTKFFRGNNLWKLINVFATTICESLSTFFATTICESLSHFRDNHLWKLNNELIFSMKIKLNSHLITSFLFI